MNNVRKLSALAALVAAAFALPAAADSDFNTGANPSASADLEFNVVVPRFIRFQVGSAGNTVDTVTFTVPGANVGDSTAIAGGSTVSVSLMGNGGDIDLEAASNGALQNTSGDTIDWADVSGSSNNANLDAPAIDGAALTITPTAGQVVNRTATWSFNYANDTVVGAGTYEGTVTYTASIP